MITFPSTKDWIRLITKVLGEMSPVGVVGGPSTYTWFGELVSEQYGLTAASACNGCGVEGSESQ